MRLKQSAVLECWPAVSSCNERYQRSSVICQNLRELTTIAIGMDPSFGCHCKPSVVAAFSSWRCQIGIFIVSRGSVQDHWQKLLSQVQKCWRDIFVCPTVSDHWAQQYYFYIILIVRFFSSSSWSSWNIYIYIFNAVKCQEMRPKRLKNKAKVNNLHPHVLTWQYSDPDELLASVWRYLSYMFFDWLSNTVAGDGFNNHREKMF